VLWCDPSLTVAYVVIPAGAPKSLPHDHRMWAVIGIAGGCEDNEFFRRSADSLEASGGRVVEAGEVLSLGPETIHAVGNPLAHTSTSGLHVYGGDLVNTPRSMWTEPNWHENPTTPGGPPVRILQRRSTRSAEVALPSRSDRLSAGHYN
jgi:predicted metal-dependent enzyme (double-stranded beta helix superfamily)